MYAIRLDKLVIEFLNVDCMDYMSTLEDNAFELAVVDPPYGIGMDGGNIGHKGFNDLAVKNWDCSPPDSVYFNELKRVSVNQIIFGGNYFKALWPTRCYVVWDKGAGFKNRTYAECEIASTSFDRNAKVFTWDPLARRSYSGKIHPTQKPVELYTYLFKHFASPGDRILDTHGGSMSSAIAAHYAGLEMTICELDKDYYLAGTTRFIEETKQMRLI